MITQAANHFLDSLTPQQKAIATISFDSDERENWFYTPVPRKGLQVREMSPYQKRLAAALLAAGLSQQGYIKAETIMSLEDVLRIAEKDDGERRNPEKYYFSIFGTPSDSKALGLSRGRPSREPELHCPRRQNRRHSQLLRLQSAGSSRRTSQGTPCTRRGRGSRPQGHAVAQPRPAEARHHR